MGAPGDLLAELSAVLVTLDTLSAAPPLDPQVHVTLHGVHQALSRLAQGDALAGVWHEAPAEERARWERDQKLLQVADTVREARFRKAAAHLGIDAGTSS